MLIRLWRRKWPATLLGLLLIACVLRLNWETRTIPRLRPLYGVWRHEFAGHSLSFGPPDRYEERVSGGDFGVSTCGRFSLIGQDTIGLKPDSGAPERALSVRFTAAGADLDQGSAGRFHRVADPPDNLCVPVPTPTPEPTATPRAYPVPTWTPRPTATRPAYLPPATLTPRPPGPGYPPPATPPPLTPRLRPGYPPPVTPTP